MTNWDAHYVVNTPATVGELIDGETVLINLDSGNYFSLRGSASFAWSLLADTGASMGTLTAELSEHYGVSVSELSDDVLAFCSRLLDEALIREQAPGQDAPARRASPDPVPSAE